MSWAEELYQIYQTQCGQSFEDGSALLPISHSTANTQIEVTLTETGSFVNAVKLDKNDGKNTIIPVTEQSSARTSGIAPMPFGDKLVYLAGDYAQFATGKRANNSAFFDAYMKQLGAWYDSPNAHPAVKALYAYLSQATLMQDLIACDVLETDPETGQLAEGVKRAGIAQEDAFLRFQVQYADPHRENRTWKDQTLYDNFIAWNSQQVGEPGICYATGVSDTPISYLHPQKIRNTGDKAKLFAANDESGFTYRGRFLGKKEAVSIGYIFSQKMHNALKWMITRQGIVFDSFVLLVWASAQQPIPDVCGADCADADSDCDEDAVPHTAASFAEQVRRSIFYYREHLEPNTKIMLLGLDAATAGRLSVVLYSELEHSTFLANLERWRLDTMALQFDGKRKQNVVRSFAIQQIARCAFGVERGGKLECGKNNRLEKETVLRLLPCITEGKALPADIVSALYHKASCPLSYEKSYNHRNVVEVACGMIRKQIIDRGGNIAMSFDAKQTDRSYLYGCLLAIADAAEQNAYDANETERVTNARRYWSAFSARPFQTWKLIEERLRPYLDKMGAKSIRYNKMMNQIMANMSPSAFADNSALSPLYLLGYHHFTAEIYQSHKQEEE